MKVKVDQPYTLAELKPKLEAAFPEYTVKFRGPKVLIIGEGKIAGAQIFGEKKGFVRLNETFPTMGGQMLFALSILLLGVLIPFIVFLTAFKPKQVKLRDNVADFLRKEYSSAIVQSKKAEAADLLDATV
ncbi:hypothetical protein [Fluviicola chungangensis]|uniref:Uncharacterized protein n=1 Tax=Fluviicola chungangensis TaxID=2597671 RepID=A0A556N666_9FLAO|nr:hypothetical protein [Fluviicola chungangensis]TSJ47598.1 hypothetical protein FO442_00275 [Fluviicola chungangensis]